MTIHEASERARVIWGEGRFLSVRLRPDGGADVTLLRTFRQSDVRGRTFTAHQLDCNGHPVCHTDCETLEP
jgi:hypothetical protein